MNRNDKWYAWICKVSIVALICTTLDRCGHMSFVGYHARFWRTEWWTEWCDCEDDEQMMNRWWTVVISRICDHMWCLVMFGDVSLFSRCFLVVFCRHPVMRSWAVPLTEPWWSRSDPRGWMSHWIHVFWWSEYCDTRCNSPTHQLTIAIHCASRRICTYLMQIWWILMIFVPRILFPCCKTDAVLLFGALRFSVGVRWI